MQQTRHFKCLWAVCFFLLLFFSSFIFLFRYFIKVAVCKKIAEVPEGHMNGLVCGMVLLTFPELKIQLFFGLFHYFLTFQKLNKNNNNLSPNHHQFLGHSTKQYNNNSSIFFLFIFFAHSSLCSPLFHFFSCVKMKCFPEATGGS